MEQNTKQTVRARVGNLAVLYPCEPEAFKRDADGEEYEYTLEELSHGRAE